MHRALGIALAAPLALYSQATITGLLQHRGGERLIPLANCTVFASSGQHGPLVGEYSGERGRFTLAFPPDPRIRLGADCPGYRLASIDGRRSSLATFDCARPGLCAEVELTLEPLAVLEGRVLDPNGMPVESFPLVLNPQQRGARGYRATTDDRGVFRFFHVIPGPYQLEAVVRNAQRGLKWEADPIPFEMASGDEIAGVQVQLRLLQGVPFRGRIEGAPAGLRQAMLWLTSVTNGSRSTFSRTVSLDAEGRFSLADIPRGAYQVEVILPGPPGGRAAPNRLHIGAVDITGAGGEVVLSGSEPSRVSGRLEVEWPENAEHRARLENRAFNLYFYLGGERTAVARALPPEFTFDLRGLPEGRYEVRTSAVAARLERRGPSGQWEPFRMIDTRAGAEQELDLRMRFELGELTVVVRPGDGHYVVGIRSGGVARLYPTDQNGLLTLDPFPAGDYQICAWRDLAVAEANDPDTWERAGDAVREFRQEDGAEVEITLEAVP